MKSKVKLVLMIIAIILIDQICKINIIKLGERVIGLNNIFTVSNYSNSSLAYSLGVDSIILLLSINIIIIYFLLKMLIKNYRNMSNAFIIGITLILSGEISNLFDRISRGYIINFISIFKSMPFNIADISIVVGIIIIIISFLVIMIHNQENK